MKAQVLTTENIKCGLTVINTDHPEYGEWTVSKDPIGWVLIGRAGSKMIADYDLKYYHIA